MPRSTPRPQRPRAVPVRGRTSRGLRFKAEATTSRPSSSTWQKAKARERIASLGGSPNRMDKQSSASGSRGLSKDDGDRRDSSRKALKRTSSGTIKSPQPAKTTSGQITRVLPKRVLPKRTTNASPRKASTNKANKSTTPSARTSQRKPKVKTTSTNQKTVRASPKKAKPKGKTSATRVVASKLKGRAVITKPKKATTKKDKKPAVKPKAKGKANASATKVKPKSPKTQRGDKKGKVAKTKKVSGAKETQQKGKKVARHPNSNLTPNLDIVVVDKDPMFEVKNEKEIPVVSDYVNSKRAIRAVLTKDNALLKKLIKNTKEIPSMFIKRSVCLQEDALDYAFKTENHDALKLLILEANPRQSDKRKSMPRALMDYQGTGSYNYRTFGHAVRAINLGRGCREGNNAFTKDLDFYTDSYDSIHERYKNVLSQGLSMDTVNLLSSLSVTSGFRFEESCADIIFHAVRAGHHKLAGHLVKKANVGGGYGFNRLHKEVLLSTKPEQLNPFRSVSVLKKPFENDKITPLHCAAINPNPKILAKLLMVMPDVYAPDKVGFMPIHYAAACEGTGPLELLLNRGAKADDVQPKTLITPLMIAAKYGRAHNIEKLIKNLEAAAVYDSDGEANPKKMGIDKKSKNGHYAIHYAAEGGHVDCVRSLVKHGTGVETMESAVNNKITPLMIAAERGHFQLAKVLIEEMEAVIEKRDKIKRTPLMLACMNGHYHIATLLLRKGADPNVKDSSGNTPVHYAAAYGWWHCLKLLLKAGGDPNIFNDWKVPPLGVAYLKGHFGCLDLLFKQPGVDVNFRDENGATLFLTTCARPTTEDVLKQLKYLIQKGADVQAVDINGKNALHFIAILDQRPPRESSGASNKNFEFVLEAIKLFIDEGCNPALKDKEGQTPISIAVKNSNPALLKAFLVKGDVVSLDANCNGDNPVHSIAKNCSDDGAAMIQILGDMEKERDSDEPMDVDDDHTQTAKVVTLEEAAKMKDGKGYTPFLRCLHDHQGQLSNPDVYATVKALIEICKSDINACVDTDKPRCCFFALHLLAARQPSQVWSMIIELKPQLEVLNDEGYTPLLCAIIAGQTGNIKRLLSEGANPNASTTNSLHLAVQRNLPDIIPHLIAKGVDIHSSLFENKQPSIMHYIPTFIEDLQAKLRLAKELLAAGASLDAVDDEKRTVLHNAVNIVQSNVTTEFLEFLLDYKLDVFAVDKFGRLPIHYAFYKYNSFGHTHGGQFNNQSSLDPIETVSLLAAVMNGKQLNVQDKYGRTPLHYAAYRGAMISAMHIAERISDFDVEDENGHTPLSMAVLNRQQSMAIWLIQKGANVNRMLTLVGLEPKTKDDPNKKSNEVTSQPKYWTWKALEAPSALEPNIKTSIFQAIVYEDWQGAVYIMMDRIAKFGISYPDAIEAVLAQQKFQLASELIRKLRNPRRLQTTNDKNQNLLHLLAIHAEDGASVHARIAESLLENGVKLFASDHKGCTPLHYAAINKNAVLCRVFAEKDPVGFASCITYADHRARVPVASLFWGLSYNNQVQTIVSLIRKSKGSLDVCMAFPDVSVLHKKEKTRSESLEEWYHNLPDEKTADVTPLIFMILMNNFEGCKLLLQNDANPNTTDKDGMTPLMHAVRQNEIVLVNVLLNHSYEPEKAGMKRISNRQHISAWTTNIWGEKKSGSYSSRTAVHIEDGYEENEEQDKSKIEKYKKTSTINLNAVDLHGRTAVHYLMKTRDDGTYENEEMLELLAKYGAKLSQQDNQGKTPLDYAVESGSHKMVAAVQKLTRVAPQKRVHCKPVTPTWTDGIKFPSPKPDVDSDAQAMIELLEAERSKTRKIEEFKPKVDQHSGMSAGGVVVMDEEQDIGYDLTMTKVEVQYGRYGLNNFYRMQVIYQLGKDMTVLFTRWGRIGDHGQFQKTPFGTKEEAIAEFKKIFKAKSGNDWANVKSFQKRPNKYMLVQSDPWRAKRNEALKKFQFDLDSSVPSKLPKDMRDVLHELTKPQTLKRAFQDTGVDTSIMNFSNLSKDILQKANDVLDKISELIKSEDAAYREQGIVDIKKSLAFKQELYDLSNEYFYLIPHENFAHDVMQPVTDSRNVELQRKKLYNLLELEMTNRILLGATYRKQEIHPLDYIYRALDCHLKLMDEDDAETQLLLQYIHNSSDGNPPKVEAIFRLSREGENERLKACKLGNHRLLWHGSSAVNLLGIMKQGLLISPREAEWTGSRFGEGIYTSDAFAKSIAYCRRWCREQNSQFMLLCEVALGQMAVAGTDDQDKKKFNCTFARGRAWFNRKRDLLLPSGVVLPLGRLSKISGYSRYYMSDYSEFVAHTEEQVCLRYLVQVSSN